MAFVNASLLLGGLLIGVPILLHLLLRQQPRRIEFPALRFVQQRARTNRRTLQLRQWLLLLLRCAAVALLALALARPSVSSAALGSWIVVAALLAAALLVAVLAILTLVFRKPAPAGKQQASIDQQQASFYRKQTWLAAAFALVAAVLLAAAGGSAVRAAGQKRPLAVGNRRAAVAAVLVFDTSARMQYRQANQTRLEQARDLADWLLDELPPDSQVAVAQSHPGSLGFSIDLAAAKRTVERLRTTGVPRPLSGVVAESVELAGQSELPQREVYVFTDLTESAWGGESGESGGRLRELLAETEDLPLYVIDVGAEHPKNFALGAVELSAQRMPSSSELRIRTELRSLGVSGARTVALLVEQPDVTRPMIMDGQPLLPVARQRGRRVVSLEADAAQVIEFRLSGLPVGTHQGRLVIEGDDALAIDDTRYFTVDVERAWPVLVVADAGVNSDNLVDVLAPYEQRVAGTARFECRTVTPAELPNVVLEDVRAVCLIDPSPLPPSSWEALARFVSRGGGLAVFLGYNATNGKSFNEPAAQQLLPGPLGRQWRSAGRDLYLAPRNFDHPALAEFRPLASQVPWHEFPVFRHWSFRELSGEARVVCHFGNGQPALVETPLGAGRVLTMTTPITEPARPRGRQPWNELTGPNDWPRFVLVNEMLRYLVDTEAARLNYLTGETARLANNPQRYPRRYQLFAPPDEIRQVTARDGQILVRATDVPGAYRLKGNRGGVVIRGLAVNLPVGASDLTRADTARLDQVLGENRYQLARRRDEIEVGVGTAREGHEFFPLLLVMLALMLGLEHVLSNRFYRTTAAEVEKR